MAFDPKELVPLAEAVAKAGAPILGKILGTVLPFPFNMLASGIVSSLATAFGAPADDPPAIAAAIQKDPDATAKITAVAEAHADDLVSALDFAKLQTDIDMKEAENPSLFIAGWRPGLGWSLAGMVTWQWVASAGHWPLVGDAVYNGSMVVLASLLGVRAWEKFKCVDTKAIAPLFRKK